MTDQRAPFSYTFGRFELQPAERRLLVDGEPAAVGPRAFDVLVTLVERAGRLVTKDELLELVWPDLLVEENNLQVQVSALRKLLGAETIVTVQGRGYRFTLDTQHVTVELPSSAQVRKHNLPQQLTSFIGREKEFGEIATLLGRTQSLTLTGAGACGKTVSAFGLSPRRSTSFRMAHGSWSSRRLRTLPSCPKRWREFWASKEIPGKSITQTLTEHLQPKRLLLLLDNCEHLLDACAKLADVIMRECPHVKILASSREPLGIAGQQTYRVPSLSPAEPERSADPADHFAVRVGTTLHQSRPARARGFCGHPPECSGFGVGMPSPGQHSAGHRVGGGAGALSFS